MAKNRTKTEQKNLKDVKVWFRDTSVKKNGTAPVYLYIYLKGKKVVFNTNVSLEPTHWNYNAQNIFNSHPHARDYNLIIDNCKARIHDIFVRYRLQMKELTPELLKREYEIPSTYIDFYDFMARTIASRKDELEPSTMDQHHSILNKLRDYKSSLMFSEIDEKFIHKYRQHLQRREKMEPWTVYNHLSKIKSYLSIAVKDGVIRKNPFDGVPLKKPLSDREFHTDGELRKLIDIYEKKLLPAAYHPVLRWYLFSCFTSLAISDLRATQHENIMNGILIYFRKKTMKKKPAPVKIPLPDYALKLIRDENPQQIRGPLFDMWADQVINRKLKDIMEFARIDKNISFHVARHTFATTFLRNTKNIVALQKLMGHSSMEVTMIYAHLLTEDLAVEMRSFEQYDPRF